MPVDDTNLNNMLILAREKLDSNDEKQSQLRIFIAGCNEIKKTLGSSEGKMEIKKDRYLGTKISVTRRQAIYDKLVADKITLGL